MAKKNRRAKEQKVKEEKKHLTPEQNYEKAVQYMVEDANHGLLPKFKH